MKRFHGLVYWSVSNENEIYIPNVNFVLIKLDFFFYLNVEICLKKPRPIGYKSKKP